METLYGSFWRKNTEIPENVKVLKRESEDDENEEYQDSNDHSKSSFRTNIEKRCRLWQLIIGKNCHMTLKISILPFSQEKLNIIY